MDRVNAAVNAMLKDPGFLKFVVDNGGVPRAGRRRISAVRRGRAEEVEDRDRAGRRAEDVARHRAVPPAHDGARRTARPGPKTLEARDDTMTTAAKATPPDRELEGRVAVVLGAGSIGAGWGIGKAICMLYARAGAHVVAVDREPAAAQETRDLILQEGGSAEAVSVDVSNDEGLLACLEAAGTAYGGIDILYFNVGIGKAGPSTETTVADWRRISDANLTALHLAATTVVPAMRKRRRGVILATASIAGLATSATRTSPTAPPRRRSSSTCVCWRSRTRPTASGPTRSSRA